MTQCFRWAVILACLYGSPLATAQDPPREASGQKTVLGRDLADRLEARTGSFNDLVVENFVDEIAQQLAASAGMQSALTVRILDSAEPAAYTLPGGFLLIPYGLLVQVETTAELAAVLAHDIAHIAAGHGVNLPSAQPYRFASVPLLFLGGPDGLCRRFSRGGTIPLATIDQLKDQEQEADLLALEYLHQAGYDPVSLIEVSEKLLRADAPEFARITSAARDRAQQYDERRYLAASSELDSIRERLPSPRPQREQDRNPPTLQLVPTAPSTPEPPKS